MSIVLLYNNTCKKKHIKQNACLPITMKLEVNDVAFSSRKKTKRTLQGKVKPFYLILTSAAVLFLIVILFHRVSSYVALARGLLAKAPSGIEKRESLTTKEL